MSTLMSARLRDYRMLWRAAVSHANPRSSGILRWGGAFLVIAAGTPVVASHGPRAGLAFFWCAASVILLMNWAWRFMPGAVKLNTPANARLVPQMRRRLVELSCLVCLAGIAGVATAPYANASELGGWLFWIVFLTVGTGLATAGHQAGSAIIASGCFASVLVGELPASVGPMLSHPLAVLLALPVYAGVIVVAVHAMFPQAGERHWNMLARRARWASAAGKRDPLVEQAGGAPARSWYAASLRRASARRDGRRLLMHALGPIHHQGDTVVALGLLTLGLAAIGLLVSWRVDREVVAGIGWLFGCVLLIVPLSYSLKLGQMSGNHAGEQALVRLAPAAPATSAAFNGQLGRSLVRQVLVGWLLASGAALLLTALGGAGGATLLRLASICCLLLPMAALPLRNHARRSQWQAVVAIVLLLVSVAASIVLGMTVNALAGLALLPVAAVASIAFAVAGVVSGLRTMRHAPCAFPAGRMD